MHGNWKTWTPSAANDNERPIVRLPNDGAPGTRGRQSLNIIFGRSRIRIGHGIMKPTIRHAYDPAKAAQMIAYFALREGRRLMDTRKAMTLVYLADREHAARWGMPVLDEPRVSRTGGPANLWTEAHAAGFSRDPGWSRVLAPSLGGKLRVLDGVSLHVLDRLNEAVIDALNAVWSRFGRMGAGELKAWTADPANMPECRATIDGDAPIPLEDILSSVGISRPAENALSFEGRRSMSDLLAQL